MATRDSLYYGTYCMLEDTSGDTHVHVDGNMVVIGTELDWTSEVHVTERGKEVPRIILSRGENAIGFLPNEMRKRVQKLLDAGWTCRAFSSASIFYKLEDRYLTEVAIICYAPEHAREFDAMCSLMAKRLAKGEHPAVALSEKETAHVLSEKGQWADTKQAELPKLMKGAAYYKTKQTATERMALSAASGNKGCYVAVVACLVVIIAIVCLLVFLLA